MILQSLGRSYPSAVKIEELRGFPKLTAAPSCTLPPIDFGSAIGASRKLPRAIGGEPPAHSVDLKKLVTSGMCVTGAGTVALQADKIAAMSVPDLAHLLRQTPEFALTPASSQTFAEALKAGLNDPIGRVVVVGVSGGFLAVGVAKLFRPNSSYTELALWFLGGALLLAAIVWSLYELGVLTTTSPSP